MKKTNITILGAGFAGIAALHVLKKHQNLHITLINTTDHFLFTPLLPEVTTGRLTAKDITIPLKEFCRSKNITLITEQAININSKEKSVTTTSQTISHDYLIAAPGALKNYFGVEGAESTCFVLKTIEDATRFTEHCIKQLQQGERRIAIVGGGPTGVEVAADLKHAFSKQFSKEILNTISIELFQRGERLLEMYPKKVQTRALQVLEEKGVFVRLNTPVTKISDKGVHTPTETISTSCILWATGIRPCVNDLTEYPEVFATLQTKKFREIFIAGDSALLTYPGTEDRVPALAQIAQAQGALAAKNILSLIQQNSLKEFYIKPTGILVSLGHNQAGGQIGPIAFTGNIASIFWKLVYSMKMPTMKKKVGLLKKWFI